MSLDPEVAEALTCHMGIQLALSLNVSHVRIESYCKFLIKRLHSTTPECTELGEIVADIRFLCSNFISFDVSFIPRTQNQTAHQLAKFSYTLSNSEQFWFNALPFEVLSVVF